MDEEEDHRRRRSAYKRYYEKEFLEGAGNADIPESTLRSQMLRQNQQQIGAQMGDEDVPIAEMGEEEAAPMGEREDVPVEALAEPWGNLRMDISGHGSALSETATSPEVRSNDSEGTDYEIYNIGDGGKRRRCDTAQGHEDGNENIDQLQDLQQAANCSSVGNDDSVADVSIPSTLPVSPRSVENMNVSSSTSENERIATDVSSQTSPTSDREEIENISAVSMDQDDSPFNVNAPIRLSIESDSSDSESDVSEGMQRGNGEEQPHGVEVHDQQEAEESIIVEAHDRCQPQVEELYRQSFTRLRQEIDFKFKQTIKEPVTATYGEALLNALELSKHHKWNHSETSNVVKLLNSLFDKKILGDSRYLVDALFFSEEGMHSHYFCLKCSALLPVVNLSHRREPVQCELEVCSFMNPVQDLKKESYFVTFDVPYQLEFLFKCDKVRSQLKDPLSVLDSSSLTMKDIHDGSAYRAFAKMLDKNAPCKYLSFTVCADSSPLYKSSGCSITPCFLMVNELPTLARMKHLVCAGLWFGSKKAKMDLFMKPIVNHLNTLSEPGFSIPFGDSVVLFRAYLICCCVDSGARGEVQGIHLHRGKCGCNWCLHPGVEFEVGRGSARRYPFVFPFPELRTAEQMVQDWEEALRTKRVVNGCTVPSHLAGARYFNIVDGMIYDYMHNFCEGNVKKFLNEWLSAAKYLKNKKDNINMCLKSVKCPLEFRKAVRDLDVLQFWTGRELENFGLCLSVCLLIDKLPQDYLKHWCSYVQVMHLLLAEEISPDMINIANELEIDFVGRVEYLYGLLMMRYNVHIGLHKVQNVMRWGNLFAVSAFAFEHGNYILKHVIFANKGIPKQVCRAVSQGHSINFMRNSLNSQRCQEFSEAIDTSRVKCKKVGDIKLLGKSSPYSAITDEEKFLCRELNIVTENCSVYGRIQIGGWHYCTEDVAKKASTDNSKAWLDGKEEVVTVKKLIHQEDSDKVWVLYAVVRCTPYEYPQLRNQQLKLKHRHLLVANSIDGDLVISDARNLHGVFVNLDLDYGHYLSPMPNCFNIF